MTPSFRDVATVSLYVGDEEAVFNVHIDLLCGISTFFKAAFSSEFLEAAERSMSLEDDDVATFERFVSWLYTRRYELSAIGKDERYMELAKLYVLADKYNVSRLKKEIIDQLFEIHEASDCPPSLDVVTYVYENYTANSSFRKLLVRWAVWHIGSSWFGKASTPGYLWKPQNTQQIWRLPWVRNSTDWRYEAPSQKRDPTTTKMSIKKARRDGTIQ